VHVGPGDVFVAALAIDPSNPQIVYAGTEGGVLRSVDGGTGWTVFDAGLGGGAVNALAVAPTGRVVYAGTTTGGVFTHDIPAPVEPPSTDPPPVDPAPADPAPAEPAPAAAPQTPAPAAAPGPSTPLVAQRHGSTAPQRGATASHHGATARFHLSPDQLLINQRISQAAIRRLNAVEAWLRAGIVERDLAGYGIGTRELGAGIEAAGGPVVASRPASPRPVTPARGTRGNAARVQVSADQLLINQRISQAAVRRANALEKRIRGGLTGGDVRDGAISAAVLTRGLAIVGTGPAPVVAASRTQVAPARRGAAGAVALATGQLRINQRISQAAVRRSNALIRTLEAGLTGANFRADSLTSADLSPTLR
jgi:hypothetical protein